MSYMVIIKVSYYTILPKIVHYSFSIAQFPDGQDMHILDTLIRFLMFDHKV